MTHQDAIFALMLCAYIHGTHKAVKHTALRCAELLPEGKRVLMLTIAESSHPLDMVAFIEQSLNNTQTRRRALLPTEDESDT